MRAPTMLRKKATAHYAAVPVGARIARPRFVQHSLFALLLFSYLLHFFLLLTIPVPIAALPLTNSRAIHKAGLLVSPV